jgi:hypothetical protein
MDQDEARNIAEKELQEKSLEGLYETVLIPALRLAEEDRHTDAVGERTSEFISQSTREIIDDLSVRAVQQGAVGDNQREPAPNKPFAGIEVVCVPARDEADELVGMMFAQLLRQAGYHANYLAIGTVESMLEAVARGGYCIACVSALPPFAVGQARSLCKRLRAKCPNLAIVVGLWGFAGGVPKAQERVGMGCTNAVATSLSEALLQIHRLSELDPGSRSDESSVSYHDIDKSRETHPLPSEAAI